MVSRGSIGSRDVRKTEGGDRAHYQWSGIWMVQELGNSAGEDRHSVNKI